MKILAFFIGLLMCATNAHALLWRLGAVTENSIRIFATTGATQKDISVTIPGIGSFTVTESVWTDTSDGSPANTYYAVFNVGGLSPWSVYSYSIFEDGVAKGQGQFKTLPDDQTTPFEVALIGCNSYQTDGLNDEIVNRAYPNGGDLIAVLHVDDLGYLDASIVTNVEGITSTGPPRDTKLAYDYVGGWLTVLKQKSDHKDWLNHNVPTFWMWGDHELSDNYMNDSKAISKFNSGTRAFGEHISLDNRLWVAGNAAYSKIALAAPDAFDASQPINGTDGRTYAYGVDIGPIRFFLHDRNSAGECSDCVPDVQCAGKICGEIASHQPFAENYGKTQLDNLKTWFDDPTHPYKILFSGITIGGHSAVENQPWLSWWPSEFQNFEAWLDSTPTVNGANGIFLFVAGDRHNFGVHKRSKSPPQNGNVNFMEYYVGTINGTSNHTAVPTGEVFNGCEVLHSESGGTGANDHWLTVLRSTGAELQLTTIDKNHQEIFQGTLRNGMGNHFLEDLPDGMQVVDVSTPSAPSKITSTGFRGKSVETQLGAIYLASGWAGITVVDSTNPASPVLAEFMRDIYAHDTNINSGKLYVASGWQGVNVLDLSNPLKPTLMGQQSTVASAYASDISIDTKNIAYIAAQGSAGLQAIDMADPSNPKMQGWLSLDDAQALDIQGDYVFVASGRNGLKIVKKANISPSTTVSTGQVKFTVPDDTPLGVHDLTLLNPDGSILKTASLINIGGLDSDGDGLFDDIDNCIFVPNADQRDTDGDGYGNLCDGDLNNDGSTDTLDLNLYKVAHRTALGDANYNQDADFNGDGLINTIDLNIYKGLHRKPPGPSCCGLF